MLKLSVISLALMALVGCSTIRPLDDVKVQDIEGTVERVGLRITQVRDSKNVLWYVRNGEILIVGNKSQKR